MNNASDVHLKNPETIPESLPGSAVEFASCNEEPRRHFIAGVLSQLAVTNWIGELKACWGRDDSSVATTLSRSDRTSVRPSLIERLATLSSNIFLIPTLPEQHAA